MSLIQALLLSLVEGLTEFLPVSSTGHLILAGALLGIRSTEFMKSFEIIIQCGAILAVLLMYFPLLLKNLRLIPKILVAFVPTAGIGFLVYPLIKHVLLGSTLITAISLAVGGIIMIGMEWYVKRHPGTTDSVGDISYRQSLIIGITQSIAMIPGVSRAAASIFGAMGAGIKRDTAVEFSFLLAIPTIAAASVLDLMKSQISFTGNDYLLLAVGLVGSFITALASIKFLLRFLRTNTFIPFAVYRIAIALVYAIVTVQIGIR